MTERIVYNKCEKCGGEIHPLSPYCTSPQCLTTEVIYYKLDQFGGYETYIEGGKYPFPGLPIKETVDLIAILKRNIIASMRLFKFPLIGLALLLTNHRKVMLSIFTYLDALYGSDYSGRLAEAYSHLSKSARELKRVLIKINPAPPHMAHWIDMLLVVYDSDMAYRYRIQNILEEVDKVTFEKNPRKEILRLLHLHNSREIAVYGGGQIDKNVMFTKFFKVFWLFKDFRTLMIAFFRELNLEEIKMTTADRYWVVNRFDYNYNGLTYDERQAWRAKEHEGWTGWTEEDKKGLQDANADIVVQPNSGFFLLSQENAASMTEQVKQTLLQAYEQKKTRRTSN